MGNHLCLNCRISEQDTPLVTLRYRQGELWICPQCLPTLIHKPEQLADKLALFPLPERSTDPLT